MSNYGLGTGSYDFHIALTNIQGDLKEMLETILGQCDKGNVSIIDLKSWTGRTKRVCFFAKDSR